MLRAHLPGHNLSQNILAWDVDGSAAGLSGHWAAEEGLMPQKSQPYYYILSTLYIRKREIEYTFWANACWDDTVNIFKLL